MQIRNTKRMWAAGAVLGALTLAGCAGGGTGSDVPDASGEFDWKRYDGESIRVYIPDTGQVETINSRLDEFTELTGITVTIESSDVTGYRQTLPVRLTARSNEFDVMATFPEVDGPQFSKNGWYEPLDDYVNNTSLTSPDYDFEDFGEGVRNAMQVNDQTVTVLWEMQTPLMYYRKDLLAEAGLDVPQTFDEWEAAAAKIHNPAENIYGFALRGIAYQTTTPFSSFLHAYCGAWVEDGKAAIDSENAVNAWETYGRWGSQYGPPGITGFDWPVPAQQFAQGNVFAFLDINLFVSDLEDPNESTVAGNVGYALVPEGECGRAPFIGGWGYSVNPFSAKKGAAWTFMQWATSSEINHDMKLTGWPSPRSSAWESADFQANDPTPEFTQVVLESTQIAWAQMNPPVAPGVEAREIAGLVGNKTLEGVGRDEIQSLATQQNAALQALIDAMN